MKLHMQPSEENKAAWASWVSTRPDSVKAPCERFNPWGLYRLKTTGQIVSVVSFSENGTLRVNVHHDPRPVPPLPLPFGVFGIKPDDLSEIPDEETMPELVFAGTNQ